MNACTDVIVAMVMLGILDLMVIFKTVCLLRHIFLSILTGNALIIEYKE
jgi:hypothetical protein